MPTLRRGRLIELGCGSMPPTAPSATVPIAVDVDLDALRRARRAATESIVLHADAMSLPFRSGSVDSISLRAVLHHLLPIETAIAEIARVLRDGAHVSVIDGVALDSDEAALLDAELSSAGRPGEPVYGFDLDVLTEQLGAVGLVVDRVELDGAATFATPPFVSRPYTSDRFHLTARKHCLRHRTPTGNRNDGIRSTDPLQE
ncbi:MAG: class I SAM-dependent methyltransferase [Actinomycetota bacterium]